MPRGKTTGKATGKPASQLLFSEALRQQKHPSVEDSPPLPCSNMVDDTQGATMDRILQEISAVSCKLEGMDNAMVALTAETRSLRLDIAGFQLQMSGLDQRVTTVETQIASWTDRDLELSHLRSKLTDLEDRSHRNNVCLLGFPEGVEESQRAHRLDPKRHDGNGCPRPIIVCMLRPLQARQLLQTARTQGLFRSGNLEIRISADFSKETADRRKAFLSFRTQLRRLDVKFGLFEPTRMWITKKGESRNFYDPEDLRTFLEGLQDQTQSMETTAQLPQTTRGPLLSTAHPIPTPEPEIHSTTDPQSRGRDFERLAKSYDDRGQVLQAHTAIRKRQILPPPPETHDGPLLRTKRTVGPSGPFLQSTKSSHDRTKGPLLRRRRKGEMSTFFCELIDI
ncbi:hypothetical protein NDU88_002779 [Pleurodeles waltl]|uniref:L1 transposable element RRM domain-containing protein n=1 Tax=Pleurodeles waltl TaxID=8319 RepID=A0AAV7TMT8_PLEWA|nr:hypothetical protein NDU88_002779 [Pleurodeles waltl]